MGYLAPTGCTSVILLAPRQQADSASESREPIFHFYIFAKAQPVSPRKASGCETAAAASPGNELALLSVLSHRPPQGAFLCLYVTQLTAC